MKYQKTLLVLASVAGITATNRAYLQGCICIRRLSHCFFMSLYRLLAGAWMVIQGLFALFCIAAFWALIIGGPLFVLRELVRFLLS